MINRIIDVHARVWNSPEQFGQEISRLLRLREADRWVRLDASSAALERSSSCTDVALVHGFRADAMGAYVPHELVAEFVRAEPRRRLGVGGIDPMGRDPLGQVQSAADLGLVAIAVSPMCQGFHPTHSAAMRVYERCAALGLPIFAVRGVPLTTGAILEFGRPSAWDEVARNFPSLGLVIGELGYPWIDEALVLSGKHANVWTEISGVVSRPWQLYNALLTAVSLGVMDKLLFGSGFPHEDPARAIENLYSLNAFGHGTQLPSVPRSAIRAIVERDALRALRLDVDVLGPLGRPIEEEPDDEVPSGMRTRSRAPRAGGDR
ncbi:MAG TPA: amidohydrolase family protein [Phycisphaerales bacterium]|nr:amidohydrolase family protein [Phycisphaerales bacterium]HMP36649.1 amidohydrolase family protein [Phycisphaerales bacterium]